MFTDQEHVAVLLIAAWCFPTSEAAERTQAGSATDYHVETAVEDTQESLYWLKDFAYD